MSKGDFVPPTDWLGLCRKHKVVGEIMPSVVCDPNLPLNVVGISSLGKSVYFDITEGRLLEDKVLATFDQGSAEPFDGRLFCFNIEGIVPNCDLDFGDPVNCVKQALWEPMAEEVRNFMWSMKDLIISSMERGDVVDVVATQPHGKLELRSTPKAAKILQGRTGLEPAEELTEEPKPTMFPGIESLNDLLFKAVKAQSADEQAETAIALHKAMNVLVLNVLAESLKSAMEPMG